MLRRPLFFFFSHTAQQCASLFCSLLQLPVSRLHSTYNTACPFDSAQHLNAFRTFVHNLIEFNIHVFGLLESTEVSTRIQSKVPVVWTSDSDESRPLGAPLFKDDLSSYWIWIVKWSIFYGFEIRWVMLYFSAPRFSSGLTGSILSCLLRKSRGGLFTRKLCLEQNKMTTSERGKVEGRCQRESVSAVCYLGSTERKATSTGIQAGSASLQQIWHPAPTG